MLPGQLRPNSGTIGADALGLSVLQYWAPQSAAAGGSSAKLPFGDGGGVDNLAIMPALRRKVAKVIVCCAVSKALGDDVNVRIVLQLYGHLILVVIG